MTANAVRLQLVAAVNDETVLTENLLASPDVASGRLPLDVRRGYRRAGLAYNAAIDALGSACDWILFVHQDVYLPRGFADRMEAALSALTQDQPAASIVGLFGARSDGPQAGRVWSSGSQREFAGTLALPARVDTIDEYLIAVRIADGLRFDDELPGYHLYATDIVTTAAAAGRTTWVVDAPTVHNSVPVVMLDKGYRSAWYYMRRKWAARLPLFNLIATVRRSPLGLWRAHFRQRRKHRFTTERITVETRTAPEIARTLGYE